MAMVLMSPSSRAEWVEIMDQTRVTEEAMSPSSRAEWVEIPCTHPAQSHKRCLRPRGRSGLKWKYATRNATRSLVSVLAGGVG